LIVLVIERQGTTVLLFLIARILLELNIDFLMILYLYLKGVRESGTDESYTSSVPNPGTVHFFLCLNIKFRISINF